MLPLLVALLIFLPLHVSAAGSILISEIAWMGTLPREGESTQAAANNEWMELYNPTSGTVSLDGWKIVALDGMPDITLSGMIAAGGYFLLERANDEVVPGIVADLIPYPYKNNALSNEGEHLFLKDASGATVDEVNAASEWPAGDNATKQTMQRAGSGWVTATGTPRAQNQGVFSPTPSPLVVPSPSAAPPASSSSGVNTVTGSSISVFAGDDRMAIVGAPVDFNGSAKGLIGEPLTTARFWWNFGDGATKEGRVVDHVFFAPGRYTVGLHASSGEYAASDYLAVNVASNQIAVSEVVEGEDGFIRLRNAGAFEIDLGGWVVEEASTTRSFTIPPQTQIAGQSEVAFANRVTGLLRHTASSLTLRYPNLAVALQWASWSTASSVPVASPVSPSVAMATNTVPLKSPQGNVAPRADVSSVVVAPGFSPTEQRSIIPVSPIPYEEKTSEVADTATAGGSWNFFALAAGLSAMAAVGFIVLRIFL